MAAPTDGGTSITLYEERLMKLEEGEPAPRGFRIVRLLATEYVPVGTGTATKEVFLVALQKIEDDEWIRFEKYRALVEGQL